MSSPILQVSGLRKSFGRLHAVDGLDFTVNRGQVFGVAGPNGAGKSTLINLLTHVPFAPDAGRVLFEGNPLNKASARAICRAGLSRTFQAEAAFDSLTPVDNVRVAARYGNRSRVGSAALEDLVHDAFATVGFTDPHPARPAGLLAPIDKKKLMIASALVTAPKLLCLDEPASGLIEPEQHELEQIIVTLKRRGITILVVEHVLPLLRSVADHLLVMAAGRLLAEGAPDDVLSDPRVIDVYTGGES